MPISQVEPLLRSSMREGVFERLRDWILDGTLVPGERIRDLDLAAALGVSRMPVREALLRLQGEGMVETSAGRWTRVSRVDPELGEQIYPLIWALEVLALQLVTDFPDHRIAQMEAANREMAASLNSGEPRLAWVADSAFHQTLADHAGNDQLTHMLSELKLKLRRLEVAYFSGSILAAQSVSEHDEVIAALRAGDLERAARGVETNWRRSLARLREQVGGDADALLAAES
ncbi:MAG TPA: GntR family transcriptional regulator [Candidatus Dormibacteraeota bacterium]|jgi:DNA-binding GntR family transcriptional regulator